MHPRRDELWFGHSLWTDLIGLLALASDSPWLARWLARRHMRQGISTTPARSARSLGVALRELPPARQ